MGPVIEFSAVVLCFNRLEFTQRTIESLKRTLRGVPAEIIAVDNASTDGTREYLLSQLGDSLSQVVLNSENLGASQGYNAGLRLAKGPYQGIIDNDYDFADGWYDECMRILGVYPEIAVVSPSDTRIPERLIPRQREGLRILVDPSNVPGCAVYRAELLKPSRGRFTVQGHLYGDTDLLLCRQAHMYGYSCAYTSEPMAEHLDKAIQGPARKMNEEEKVRIQRGEKHERLFFDYFF